MKSNAKYAPFLMLAALCGLGLGTDTRAAEVELGLHLRSWHASPSRCVSRDPALYDDGWFHYYVACQDRTPGAFVRIGDGRRWDFVAGYYQNSIGAPTWHAGAVRHLLQRGPFALEIAIAGATGYPRARVVPLVMPALRVELGHGWAATVGWMPKLGHLSESAVAHLTVSRCITH